MIRHAKAGSRGDWTGDDRLRPLTKKGQNQAEELVGQLKSFPIKSIFSSPYLRCMQTVEPLSLARKVQVKSSHGDIVWELVEELVSRHVIRAGDGGFDKGSTWILRVQDGVPVKARYLPAP